MPTVRTTLGKTFEQSQLQTLLEAASQSGFAFPYSCKSGRCSVCKCKVIAGETGLVFDEFGLSDEEKADGWILSCARTAHTDLLIYAEDIGNYIIPKAITLPARIDALERLARDVVRVNLRLPPNTSFSCLPGQYAEVIGPGGIRRSYSIANAVKPGETLELHVREVESGAMSRYWFERAAVNDLLRINGPLGTFFIRQSSNVDLFFLATGTGFAPIKAILESMASWGPDQYPRSVTLVWGGRTEHDLYMKPPSIPIRYTFIPVLSRASDDWTGLRGYVQQVLMSQRPDFSNAAVYACGSQKMIHSAKADLTAAGLSGDKFFSDAFVCSARS